MILLSQIAFRRRLSPEEVKALKFKVHGGVVTTVIGLLFLAFIIALIGYHPTPASRCTSVWRGLRCCCSAGFLRPAVSATAQAQ